MEQMKTREMLHLVALQVADEMPPERKLEGVHLFQRLLDLVLTNVLKPRVPCGLQRVQSLSLRNRDDPDRLIVPAAPHRCVDPLPNLPNPVCQVAKRHKAASYR